MTDAPRPARAAPSLKRTLLLLLVPAMVTLVLVELALTWRNAVDAANAAYDRSLLGAIKAMDANLSTDSGGLGVELPYRLLEFFELTASGQVYYRVATEDGLVEVGNARLPPPPRLLDTRRPHFTDAVYFDEPVRLASWARELDPPLAGQPPGQRVVIQVAETLESRAAFTRQLVLQAVARDVMLVAVAAVALAAAVGWALQPLTRLAQQVRQRRDDDLTPMATEGIPADVRPLVDALNQHVSRSAQLVEQRRRFIDDASHQLRTPLATLTTQVGFALRETDPDRQREALLALRTQLDETVRQTNQMLALARADNVGLELRAQDLAALAETLTRRWWSEARAAGIDLGFEAGAPVPVEVQAGLMQEALANLLHNALRYTPSGGQVTVSVRACDGEAWMTVSDSGPGMPDAERGRAGERFFRASNASQPGSGLGLAIVRSIAERHRGRLVLQDAREGGLAVSVVLPLAGDPAPADQG